jgi:hypothetical protein
MMSKPVFEVFGMTLGLLGLGIAYFAIYVGTRNERRKRELEHTERMRAMELGMPLPGHGPWLTPLKVGVLIGLVVPLVALGIAAEGTRKYGYHAEVWQACGMVGVAAVVCGSVLTIVVATGKAPASLHFADKPPVEDDAYDIVSSRG